jgi:hypothetical protein
MSLLCATCKFNQRMTQLYQQLLLLKHQFCIGLRINCLFLASRLCLPPEMLGLTTKTLYAINSLKNGIGRIHTTSLGHDSVLHKIDHTNPVCNKSFVTKCLRMRDITPRARRWRIASQDRNAIPAGHQSVQ